MKLLKETPLVDDRVVLFIHKTGKTTHKISTHYNLSDQIPGDEVMTVGYAPLRDFFKFTHTKKKVIKVSLEIVSKGLLPASSRKLKNSHIKYYSFEDGALRRWTLSPEKGRRKELDVSPFEEELITTLYNIEPDTIYRLRVNVYL